MNIVVCMKPVPDVSIISLDPYLKNRLDEDDLVYIENACDIAAVEEAIRIKENTSTSQVFVVSVAPPSTERLLRRCLALGADEGILVWDDAFQNSDSYATGVILAKAIGTVPYDLILCGNKAADTEAGQVGYVIADILDIPVVSGITSIETSPRDYRVIVERRLGRGYRQRIEMLPPALLAVEESANEPRYASLSALFSAFRREIRQYNMVELELSLEEVGAKGSKIEVIDISLPRPRPKKLFIPDSSLSAVERMSLVMSGGVTEKREELFEGNPEELSLKFVQFLKEIRMVEIEDDKL
jgi:electron transfer flavoprotein beta subunit